MLQHTENKELCLHPDIKDHKTVVAKVFMVNISSSPVDHEEGSNGRHKLRSSDAGKDKNGGRVFRDQEICKLCNLPDQGWVW